MLRQHIQQKLRWCITCQDEQGRQTSVLTKQDIRVQPITDHDCSCGIKVNSANMQYIK